MPVRKACTICSVSVAMCFAPVSVSMVLAQAAATSTALSPAVVREALVPRINDGTYRGLAAAWRDGAVLRTASVGVIARNSAPIDPSTVFELGELDGVLVATLLAHLVSRGDVSLDDLAQRFMPPGIRLPTRDGRAITLGDLAFHRAGLPASRGSTGVTGAAGLARAVAGLRLESAIGTRYVYARLGTDLLALALERHVGMPIQRAVEERILGPLGITELFATDDRSRPRRQRATGHTATGDPVPAGNSARHRWRGSIVGIAQFVAAASDTSSGPLASTFALMMRARSVGPDRDLPVSLGWRVLQLDGRDLYWHDALEARGFAAFIAADPGRQRAAVVLSNTARPVDVLAGQLLLGSVPDVPPAQVRTPRVPRSRKAASRRTAASSPRNKARA